VLCPRWGGDSRLRKQRRLGAWQGFRVTARAATGQCVRWMSTREAVDLARRIPEGLRTGALRKMLKPYRPAGEGCTQTTKRCHVESWKPDGVRPDCCTRHMVELLTFVHELLERHGIRHWLDYGTLLGRLEPVS